MRTSQAPMHGAQLWPGFGVLITPPRMRRSALARLVAVLMMSACSHESPTSPSDAAVNSGAFLERRIGDVGGGGGTGQCPGETCGSITVELSAPDGSTFTYVCDFFFFNRELPQTVACASIANGTGTGRFSKWTLGEENAADLASNRVALGPSSVDLRIVFDFDHRGYLSEGTLNIQDLVRNVPCVVGEPALLLQAVGHLPQFGRVTATISGTCPPPTPPQVL